MLIIGLVLMAVGVEAVAAWRLRRDLYEVRDSELSLGLALGWVISGAIGAALMAVTIAFGYAHRIFDFGAKPWGALLLIVLADLIYYVWHRLNHRVPWLWASHFPHHTAKRLNVLASIRQGWTDVLSGTWLFWSSLGFLGYTPLETGAYFSLLLVWDACVHSEWAPKLGPLEWVFVTPSHHRVHHSLEPAHVDRNFGGILIVWDRLFGTVAIEGPRRITGFGLAGFDSDRFSPAQIAVREWRVLLAGARASMSGRKARVSPT
jgi:sterol desaturase/sphingolipid hydroxylase (fatty acid hydroxylase superfamily)